MKHELIDLTHSAVYTENKVQKTPAQYDFHCSERMMELVKGFEQTCREDIPRWTIATESKLVQRLIDLKQLRKGQKRVLIVQIEIGHSEDLLKRIIQEFSILSESHPEYENIALYSCLSELQSLNEKLNTVTESKLRTIGLNKEMSLARAVDYILTNVNSWMERYNKQETKAELVLDYVLITNAGADDFQYEDSLGQIARTTIGKKLAILEEKMEGKFLSQIISFSRENSVIDVLRKEFQSETEQTASISESLIAYFKQRRQLYESIKDMQKVSDELLYSDMVMEYASNIEMMSNVTDVVAVALKERAYELQYKRVDEEASYARATKKIIKAYIEDIRDRIGFLEFDEQDVINRFTRQKLALQEIVAEACEKLSHPQMRIALKKHATELKTEALNIKNEIDKLKVLAISQIAQSKLLSL